MRGIDKIAGTMIGLFADVEHLIGDFADLRKIRFETLSFVQCPTLSL